ncbi:RagB/SusD family nutrient uptake outer membrane protein [Flavisolibacter nicotianae]|uniref:RagB/SusD family nutrient uptake outer membrane protein n=1 Tax=Flavisolibacter nicotianae TaxID=2364882 RepID=UPI0013C40AAF|nr:RagB/SusD family nutrient uptake outer membrane protein [Flavisolibacter nicotianae]
MKKNTKVLLGLLLLTAASFSITGCKKFLDRKPLSATLTDYGSAVDGQAIGMYSVFNTYAGYNTLPWLDFNSIRDDDAQKGSSATDGAEINAEFETFQYTKDDWATNTYWNDHYYLINKANQLLFTADSLKLNDPGSLRNIGEAHFFRAYSYFELVKAYGEVPKIDFFYTEASKGVRPKSTVAEIYALIDKDLQAAAQYLPLTWFNSTTGQNPFPGRLTSGAANTLWAKTYLFRQNWAMVLGLCNQVIASNQYSLAPKFTDVWREGPNGLGKNGPESILEMQAYVAPGTDYGVDFGTSQNVRTAPGFSDQTWNLGWGWNTPTEKLQTQWPSSDPRKSATILYSGRFDGGPDSAGFGGTLPPYVPGSKLEQPYWNKKVYSDPAVRQLTGHLHDARWINHRILRYADVLLMKAEAANELNDGATAASTLELVRARARGGNNTILPPVVFQDQAQMRKAIKDERRWEFAMEGYRFYDLVRWGDAQTELGPLGYSNRARYYPIPQKAIDLSGGVLTQNPEWQ